MLFVDRYAQAKMMRMTTAQRILHGQAQEERIRPTLDIMPRALDAQPSIHLSFPSDAERRGRRGGLIKIANGRSVRLTNLKVGRLLLFKMLTDK